MKKSNFKNYLKTHSNLLYLSDLTKNNYPLFNNRYNQYYIVLNKNISKYESHKFLSKKNWILFKICLLLLITILLKVYKYYNIIYYYFMYEIDIRNPKVSDYFLKRYR